MQKIKRTIRLGMLSVALAALLLITSNAFLLVHLQIQRSSQVCHNDSHHKRHDDSPKPHNHDKCPICQVLLGSAGKYLNVTHATVGLVIAQPPWTCGIQSQITDQHTPGVAEARGPPSC